MYNSLLLFHDYFMIGVFWALYLHKYFFDVVGNKLETINMSTRLNQKRIKSSKNVFHTSVVQILTTEKKRFKRGIKRKRGILHSLTK